MAGLAGGKNAVGRGLSSKPSWGWHGFLALAWAALSICLLGGDWGVVLGQETRFGRSYGMFGERILGQPIRPPQPRFSQGIERSPDGTFQGIRPPGSVSYPRAEAFREARQFRAREWLTPRGNWGLGQEPTTRWSVPEFVPALPESTGANTAENQLPMESLPSDTPPSGEAVSGEGVQPTDVSLEAGWETGEAGLAEGVSGATPSSEPSLPAPSRWVNSTRAPRKEMSQEELISRSNRLIPAEKWRDAIQSFLEETARSWHISGRVWENVLAQRIVRALPNEIVSPVRVTVREGVAILEGTVRTEEAKSLAGRMLQLEPGIWQVDNRLVVAGP
jgi:hypothetical protein